MKYKRRISMDIKNKIILNISDNFIEYLIIMIIFVIGIIFGTIYINNLDETQQLTISNYITDFINTIYNGGKVSINKIFKTSLKNNLSVVFLIGLAGLSVIGMPILYIIIALKGFSIGYTISSIIASIGIINGIKFVFLSLFLQNIFIIPSIIILAVSGIKLYKNILKNRRRDNIKKEIIKYIILIITAGLINIMASFIEVYISANGLISIYNF